MAITSARVDIEIVNNATWEDAFIFGEPEDAAWTLSNQNFRVDVKGSKDQAVALLTLTTANGRIVVDDVVQRVIHFNVPDADVQANLLPGDYVYDLIMIDNSNPAVRVALMHGKLKVRQGVTGD